MIRHSKMHSAKGPASGTKTTQPPSRDRSGKERVQGEGNYDAARAFDEAEQKFVASGKVPAAARAAAPKSQAEQETMLEAEQEGKRRAKK